jgi:5-methyltetrahydrofolate--homocysteine methyltransferase
MNHTDHLCQKILEAVVEGYAGKIENLTSQALDAGCRPAEIIEKGLIPAMEIVGKRFQAEEIYLPEMLLAAKTMHISMKILKPLISANDSFEVGTAVLGTVQGDLHDIGKNLVGMTLEGAGFRVVDLGIDVGPKIFVDAVRVHNADILGMSALLTTTVPKMRETIRFLQDSGLRAQVTVLVGGAPLTQEFATEMGADGYAENAAAAAETAKKLLSRRKN